MEIEETVKQVEALLVAGDDQGLQELLNSSPDTCIIMALAAYTDGHYQASLALLGKAFAAIEMISGSEVVD